MDQTRLGKIVYAQGFIGDFIEQHIADVDDAEDEHTLQIAAMWEALSTGLDELRRENSKLELKLLLAKGALN